MSQLSQKLQQQLRPLQAYWQKLNARERLLLKCGGVFVLIGVLYWVIWQPLVTATERAQQQLDGRLQTLQWVQENSQRYRQLAAQSGRTQQVSGSLQQRFSHSARELDINVSRMQPQGEQLLVVIDELSFNQLLNLLNQLQRGAGLVVDSLDVVELNAPGQVRVRKLVLELPV
ncbi:type II secretion system protein GspM [Idiomarina xiamenensis]|uniref:Type II secretion system protein M n=1 Tax=Idiomarina xiamenensis 10-D-4 TaxID=740709 RepID=K2JP06_9GAMM|nr:type II secretion system protein M [Idiomarina xiamenensis]EKE85211.1 general secretion pathway M protein [Idiomarina xiamenensis 10-D-4]